MTGRFVVGIHYILFQTRVGSVLLATVGGRVAVYLRRVDETGGILLHDLVLGGDLGKLICGGVVNEGQLLLDCLFIFGDQVVVAADHALLLRTEHA